jgi:hypothetical protein
MQIVATTIAMDSKVNVTIPAEARAALGIDGAMLMELDVIERGLVCIGLGRVADHLPAP